MDAKLKEIGARVREARLNQNMSQNTLAELPHLHPTYISQIESGKSNFSIEVLIRLTEALQISSDWLLRSDIPSVYRIKNSELEKLLSDCSQSQADAIINTIKQMKLAFQSINE
ncbi:MAG: helix-turn-helix transcriptional regulator [Eubacteriales bacterium]|nr:helix-turn-helix transcriptional regulator [Eubacteriales bacterium]